MALNLLFLASLVLACFPLSWSYRNGARSESCYNMLVMHERNVFGMMTVVPPVDCGSSCPYQLSMVGRVVGEDNLTVEESNPTTYQCGEVYYLQLTGSAQVTIDGIMVEARENTSSFEEGSTIWGTWVNDPNSFYHAVECNRSSTSSEGPFSNAATQNEPVDITSADLYWRAPPSPNTAAEYQQLPLEIKFWFVVVQQRLIYFYPVAGPVLIRNCTEPTSPSTTSIINPSAVSTATSTVPITSVPTATSSSTTSTALPTMLGELDNTALVGSIAGGIIALLLVLVIVLIFCLAAKNHGRLYFPSKSNEHESEIEMRRKKEKPPKQTAGEINETPEGSYETIAELSGRPYAIGMKENEAYGTNTQTQHIATVANEAYGRVGSIPVVENVAYTPAAVNIPTVQNEAYSSVSGTAVNTDTEEQVNMDEEYVNADEEYVNVEEL